MAVLYHFTRKEQLDHQSVSFSCGHLLFSRTLRLSVFCCFLLALESSFHRDGQASETRPNFVIIMADDMGYGDSSAYDGWIETPNMERMAKEGLKLTDFHSSGNVCSPTRAGLMTGRYQQRAGLAKVINADPKTIEHWGGLQDEERTFAEYLKEAGYRTAIFGKWHLGYEKQYNPTLHGFDTFRGFVSGNIDYISHYDRMETYDWWSGTDHFQEEGYLTHLLTKHAVDFIQRQQNTEQPFCLYVPHGAVHTPIQGPRSKAERGPNKQRNVHSNGKSETVKEMMIALDNNIGAILDVLEKTGQDKTTLVMFFSDNGGAKHMKNTPLRGGKGSNWEGGHRVPALFWWPGMIAPKQTSDQLAITLDIMPTLLELADVPLSSEQQQNKPLDGMSLVPLLLQKQSLENRQIYWNGQAMRDGKWKLMAKGKGVKTTSLFDLSQDIGETKDLSKQYPQRVEMMLHSLQQWKTDVSTGATPQRTSLPQSQPD